MNGGTAADPPNRAILGSVQRCPQSTSIRPPSARDACDQAATPAVMPESLSTQRLAGPASWTSTCGKTEAHPPQGRMAGSAWSRAWSRTNAQRGNSARWVRSAGERTHAAWSERHWQDGAGCRNPCSLRSRPLHRSSTLQRVPAGGLATASVMPAGTVREGRLERLTHLQVSALEHLCGNRITARGDLGA